MNRSTDISAPHFGFTPKELDFISRRDIKYRMNAIRRKANRA
jgi:hypothetical protein